MVTPEGNNLILLMSLPRSGSTLLSVLLGGNSQIHSPPEPWLLLPLLHLGYPCIRPRDFGGEHASLALQEFLGKEDLRDLSREFACGAYNRALQRTGKAIFLDKTPRYYHIDQELESLFPAAKRLWLVRNPLDVAASIKSTWNVSIDELTGSPLTQHSFDFLVGLPCLTAACKSPKPGGMVIRYEDLAARPEETIRGIARFLNLSFEPSMVRIDPTSASMQAQRKLGSGDRKILRTKSVHVASIGSWKKYLNDEELMVLAKIISRDAMIHLGYSDSVAALEHRGIRLQTEAASQSLRQQALHPPRSETATKPVMQIRQLTKLVTRHEADASARLDQVKKLTDILKTIQAESADRLNQIEKLTTLVKAHEAESRNRAGQIDQLTIQVASLRKDSSARLEQIRSLTTQVKKYEAESAARAAQVEQLEVWVQEERSSKNLMNRQAAEAAAKHEAFAAEAARQIQALTILTQRHQRDAVERLAQVQQLGNWLAARDAEIGDLRNQANQLTAWLKQAELEKAALMQAHREAEKTVEALKACHTKPQA